MRQRQKRANGRASWAAILDAAAQIAGERGYEGTSINLVSERSGLPASSIYWHFKDKDQLIEAVIDRSFTDWIDAVTTVPQLPPTGDPESDFVRSMRHAGEQVARFPDFLRLGLMLTLEHRPEELKARQRFQDARHEILNRIRENYAGFFENLATRDVDKLANFTLAGSDGIFVGANAADMDIADYFEILAHAIIGAAKALGWNAK